MYLQMQTKKLWGREHLNELEKILNSRLVMLVKVPGLASFGERHHAMEKF
jgi:hypothetical protein